MKRTGLLKFILGVLLAIVILAGRIAYQKAYARYADYYKFRYNTEKEVASFYEARNIGDTAKMDYATHHVLCIGNSITLHTIGRTRPGASPFWRGEWGMCASRPDSDYVHRLRHRLRQYNPQTIVDIVNIAVWEQGFTHNYDSLMRHKCLGKDLIILRVGENVSDAKKFETEFPQLLRYCQQFTKNIIIAGCYWKNADLEQTMIRAARENNLPYVPLFWIYDLYRDEVVAHVGDTIYDTHGKPYTIKDDFITTHPNDYGMRLIADEIWKEIRFK